MDTSKTNNEPVFLKRVALGGIALILAGLALIPQGILSRNVPTAPERNLEFAIGANSFEYRLGIMLAGISLALFVLGVFALYAYLSRSSHEKLAFAGMAITVGFLVLFLPITGFAAFVVPAIGRLVEQGKPEMIAVMDQTFLEPFLPIQFLSGILWNIGNIVIGLAIWRSKILWKWSGFLFMVYGVVGIPAFLDVKAFQLVSPALGGLAQITAGVSLRRSASTSS
jgi:hypothetical protein